MDDSNSDERARQKRIRDYNDLQDENAGRDTGKVRRFTSPHDTPEAIARKKDDDWRFLTASFSYAERLQRINERLAALDRASLRAVQTAEIRLQEAEDRLRETQRAASVSADGRRIYRTEDGRRAFFEDDTEATQAEIAGTRWKRNAPTWETFRDRHNSVRDARTEYEESRAFRERVLESQDRIRNGAPPSLEDLDRLDAQIEEMDRTMPESVREADRPSPPSRLSATREHMDDNAVESAIAASGAFRRAVTAPAAPPDPDGRPTGPAPGPAQP